MDFYEFCNKILIVVESTLTPILRLVLQKGSQSVYKECIWEIEIFVREFYLEMFQNNFSCVFSGAKLRNCANLNKIGPIVFFLGLDPKKTNQQRQHKKSCKPLLLGSENLTTVIL